MRKILLFIAACVLPFSLLASENAPKTEENIFELPISKMPPDYFKYEVAFFKEIEIDCNFALFLCGRRGQKKKARKEDPPVVEPPKDRAGGVSRADRASRVSRFSLVGRPSRGSRGWSAPASGWTRWKPPCNASNPLPWCAT